MSEKHEKIEWQLKSCDTFDRETPHQVEASGIGLQSGLTTLWNKSLLGGGFFINDGKLTETFTNFYLEWVEDGYRPQIELTCLGEEATKKLEMVYRLAVAGDMDLVKLGIAHQIKGHQEKGFRGIEPATRKFLSLLPLPIEKKI